MRLRKLALTCLLATIASISGVRAEGRLNMICSAPQTMCDSVTLEFSQQMSIDVNVIRLSAGETYAKLHAEARNPKTDVWFSGTSEPQYQAAVEKLTHRYKSPQFDHLIPQAQQMAQETDYRTFPYGIGAIGFTWNKRLLREKNLPKPRCWADLLKPEYAQEIALANPNTAGTGYTTLVSLVALMGEDSAFDYLKKLSSNVSSYSKSGTAVPNQVARGEAAIGIVFLANAMTLLTQGFPIETITPCEGTGYTLYGVSIIEGAKNLSEAKIFMDWILSPEGQAVQVASGAHVYPTTKGVEVLEHTEDMSAMKLLDLDPKIYGAPDMRKKLLARWDREIGPLVGKE